MTRCAVLFAALAVTLLYPSTAGAVRSEFFGIVQGQFNAAGQLDDRDLQEMQAARIRTDRFEIGWRMVQPSQGEFRWGGADQFIGALASHGIRAVPFVWGSPSWVAPSPGRPPIDTTAHQHAWRVFLKAAVARYGPGGSYWQNGYPQRYGAGATPLPIQAWQVWNEPNLKKFFDPEGTDSQLAPKYGKLLKISHDAITNQDPQAQIILAGNPGYPPSGGPKAWEFLSDLYKVPGIRGYFDAAALHPYASDLYHVQLEIENVRNVMENNGDAATPLWITELGWGSAPPDRYGINQGLQGQKDLLSGAYKMILRHRNLWNVQRLYWFLWRDPDPNSTFAHRCSFCGSAGLLRYNRTAKPAFPVLKGFAADTKRPTVSISSGPNEGMTIKNPAPTFTLASSDLGSTYECHIDATPFRACSPKYTLPKLADGSHTLFVRAIDPPGNMSTVLPRHFTVDTTPPAIILSADPPSGSASSKQTASFTFSSDDSGATLSCQLDGAAFTACSSPFTTPQLADGHHMFRVRATDEVGNNGFTASGWTVDTVAPTVTITQGPKEGVTSPNPKPKFSFDAGESGARFQCELDGGGFQDCTSPFTPASQLVNGDHSFSVQATDRAGNTGSAVTRTWAIHAEVRVRITAGLASGSVTNNPRPGFRFRSSYTGAEFRCELDGGSFQACDSGAYSPPAPLADGQHSFGVKAISGPDESEVAQRSFTVDTVPPTVTLTSGPAGGSVTSDATPSFGFKASEPSSRFSCRVDSRDFAPCSSPHATGQLRDGRHVFRVRAIDDAYNKGLAREVRFRVDTTAPRLRIKGPTIVRTRRSRASVAFRLRASEHAGLRCRIGSAHYVHCRRHFRTPKLTVGPHTLAVKATDRAGNVASRVKRFRIVEKR